VRRSAVIAFAALSAVAVAVAACSDAPVDEGSPDSGASRDTTAGDASARAGDASSPVVKDGGAASSDGSSSQPATEFSGEATYYDANGTGACGFPASNDFYVAAINDEQYSKANCGRCVAVTGPRGTVTVRIVDKCPGCDEGDLDLSQTAFSKIAKLSDGRVKITWHFVPCP